MIRAVLIASDDADFFSYWTKPGSVAGQILLVLGVVLAIGFVIFIWAAFFRKPHRRHHSYDLEGGGLPAPHKRRSKLARMLGKKRHKRRRRSEKPTNPTLAQIGGLPPHRDQKPPS
jgi:hypothetical protein